MGRGLRGHWHHKTAALRGPLERSAVERPLLPQQCMPSSFRENASLLVCESICTGPSALLFSHPPPPPSSGQCLILAQFLKCLQAQTLQQVWSARVCMCFLLRASHTACVYMLKACDICLPPKSLQKFMYSKSYACWRWKRLRTEFLTGLSAKCNSLFWTVNLWSLWNSWGGCEIKNILWGWRQQI